jgi:hypothetical protein
MMSRVVTNFYASADPNALRTPYETRFYKTALRGCETVLGRYEAVPARYLCPVSILRFLSLNLMRASAQSHGGIHAFKHQQGDYDGIRNVVRDNRWVHS